MSMMSNDDYGVAFMGWDESLRQFLSLRRSVPPEPQRSLALRNDLKASKEAADREALRDKQQKGEV